MKSGYVVIRVLSFVIYTTFALDKADDMDEQGNFSVALTINNEEFAIDLTRILLPAGVKYFAQAISEKGETYHFEIRFDPKQKWKLAPSAPKLFTAIENELVRLIQNHTNNNH